MGDVGDGLGRFGVGEMVYALTPGPSPSRCIDWTHGGRVFGDMVDT
jgi:hypothetical protein